MAEIKDMNFYLKLSRAVNGSFGDTGPGTARISSEHANVQILDEELIKVNYQCIVNIGSSDMIEKLNQKWEKDGMSLIEGTLENTIENFKKLFPDDKAPSFDINMNSASDHIEYVGLSAYSPTKRAFYKLTVLVNVKK